MGKYLGLKSTTFSTTKIISVEYCRAVKYPKLCLFGLNMMVYSSFDIEVILKF